jgi:hypothetical protein
MRRCRSLSPSCVLDRRIRAFSSASFLPLNPAPPPPRPLPLVAPSPLLPQGNPPPFPRRGPRIYPLIPLSARTAIRSADVLPPRIASEKIGLAPAPQLLGPAMLQSRELVASSWHGLGRFRVNFIRGPRCSFASRSRIGATRRRC